MAKKYLVTFILITVLIFSACTSSSTQTESQILEEVEASENSISIVTTFYPVEEITKAIVGNLAEVSVLIGPGIEPHSYEPTPKQIVSLSNSDIFILMDGMFEHVEEELIEANPNLILIESTHNLELIDGEDHDHDSEEHEEEDHEHEDEFLEDSHDGHEHEEFDYDPHVWLSIHNMESMTEEILEHLVELYPENSQYFEDNAQVYLERLEVLEEEYNTTLAVCEHHEIIVNHQAFGYIAHEYGFEQISVAGFSPESEPTPKSIQNVVDEAKEHNLKYVFSEGQMDPKFAQTIANDIEGEVLELNPIKNSDDENYFSIMESNLENLKLGLNCSN